MNNVAYQKREDRGKNMLNELCKFSTIIQKTPQEGRELESNGLV